MKVCAKSISLSGPAAGGEFVMYVSSSIVVTAVSDVRQSR